MVIAHKTIWDNLHPYGIWNPITFILFFGNAFFVCLYWNVWANLLFHEADYWMNYLLNADSDYLIIMRQRHEQIWFFLLSYLSSITATLSLFLGSCWHLHHYNHCTVHTVYIYLNKTFDSITCNLQSVIKIKPHLIFQPNGVLWTNRNHFLLICGTCVLFILVHVKSQVPGLQD